MASWHEFAEAAPELAEPGRELWQQHGLMFLATARRDGSPRLHPVVPVLADGSVFVAIGAWSPKCRDLDRDPRCVLHSLPGPSDDEFVMRCRARERPDAIESVRAVAGHVIHADDNVYELDLERVDLGWWEHVGLPNTYPVRYAWTPTNGVRELRAGRSGLPQPGSSRP